MATPNVFNFWLLSLFCLILLEACSVSPNRNVMLLDLACKETVCFTPVDSAIARSLVPSGYELYSGEKGAEILFIIQDCSEASMKGRDYAPLQMSHIWIRIVGPDTISAVEGAPSTYPTFYWWEYAGRTTVEDFGIVMRETGKQLDLVDEIQLSLTEQGRIIETKEDGSSSLIEWFTTPQASQDTLGVNHLVYGKYGDRNMTFYDRGIIRCQSRWGQTRIVIGEGSVLSDFGTELYGFSLDFNMNFSCRFETTTD